MAAKKKTGKVTTAKKAAKKPASSAAASKKKSSDEPAKKTAAKKAASKKSAAKKPAKATAKKPDQKKVSSLDVNMGHVFSLRPRTTTSFKPGDFSTAKHQLRDESYSDIHEAARAVVEKALELTQGGPMQHRGRRF